MKFEISVILPCYNSRSYIFKNFVKINNKIRKHFKKIEYILVNDGSTDSTLNELKNIKSKFKHVKIISFKVNQGKSNGVKNAIKASNGKKLLLYDSDIPYFAYLDKFILNLKKRHLVIVNRRHKNSRVIIEKKNIYNFIRNFIGNFLGLINFHFFNIKIKDTQAGLKGFSNSYKLRKQKFISKKFFLDIEILNFFRQKNIEAFNVPVTYVLKENKSSIKLHNIKNNFLILKEYINVISNI